LVHREMTDEERIEVGLITLAYICEGDEQVFAEHLVKEFGVPFEKASETAAYFAAILEERRAVAEDPRRPV